MRTKMTEMCEVKYPIMNAGMAYVAIPELVAAVSNAGGLGVLATSSLNPDSTRASIKKIRELTDKPFGANVTLQFQFSAENAKVLLEEKVPVINWSLGTAAWIIKAAHEYGGKVFGTVTVVRHALRAEKDGADGVIVTGHEAAAHGGDVTSMVLIPAMANKLKIPIIAAGGFADGRGLAAAFALGAEGISIGTAFALSKESPIHQRTKEFLYKASELDTFYTDKMDGLGNRNLKSQGALSLIKGIPSPIETLHSVMKVKSELRLSWLQLIGMGLKGNMANQLGLARAAARVELGLKDGDAEKGIIPIGQVIGLIEKEFTCQELISKIVAGAQEVLTARVKVFTS